MRAIELFDKDEGVVLTYVYRDPQKIAWAKKIHIRGFIKDKEYELIKGRQGKIDRLFVGDAQYLVYMRFVPMKRQRKHDDWFDLGNIDFCGLASRGSKMASKPVQRFKFHKG